MTAAAAVAAPREGLPEGLEQDLAAAAFTLARRMHAGGTLWAVSPAWPHHAQHLAVEFVHPVIVGTPALPAVALPAQDLTATTRALARAGDVLVVISTADEPAACDLVRRAPAWGLTTLWIGVGPRPPAGAADHVLWLSGDEMAAYDGTFILVYHLLWELAHICLEHRGLLEPDESCDGPVCITCSDEGRLGEVVRVSGTTAKVRTGDGLEDVDLSLVGATDVHDLVVVHAGMAITRLDRRP